MNTLLKSYGLSEKANMLYRHGLGKFPSTIGEIKEYMPNITEEKITNLIDELVEKKLVILINPQYSEDTPHYIFIPPFAAVIDSLKKLTDSQGDNKQGVKQQPNKPEILKIQIEKFQDNLFQDIEGVSQDLITAITEQVSNNQTTEILSEVEVNVKKFVQVILNDIIAAISTVRRETVIDQRHMVRLYKTAKQKLEEAEEIASNMFVQFRDIVGEMQSTIITPQVDSFKSFIRKLGESIEKRVQEISMPTSVDIPSSSISPEKINQIEKSLFNILTDYMSKNKISSEKLWNVSSPQKIIEVIYTLLEDCKEELIIIVPKIEKFIPLEKFNLDYTLDPNLDESKSGGGAPKKKKAKKPSEKGLSISKKQKLEVEEKLDATVKKVSELKGYELSHNVAEFLGLISDVNSESVIIESVQGWLNRLLVIRKHLDSNTQYLFLEAIEKWKNEYAKIPKKEVEPEAEVEGAPIVNLSKVKVPKLKSSAAGLKIHIISSESHDNKHVRAFRKKSNIEYLQLKNNDIIGILGDDSHLILGTAQKKDLMSSSYEISGFLTTFKPLVEVISPHISKIKADAKPSRDVQISQGFNEIIENINEYSGKKMAKKIKKLLDVAFEKDGISISVLEIKLLAGKLEKIPFGLDDEMKEYVDKELNRLISEFSTKELVDTPEFGPPTIAEEADTEKEEMIPEEIEIEPLDPDKINNLFEMFLEKINDLKGVEIGEQIDNFSDVILKLQGYSEIIEWKNNLRTVDKTLEEPFKEKIKTDFLKWKWGILHGADISQPPLIEESSVKDLESEEIQGKEEDTISILDEGYVSPGLTQSQFVSEEESSSNEASDEVDPGTQMKEYFDTLQNKLGEMKGVDLSKVLQNIVDIILETEGYSMGLKGIKDWISKLRMIRKPLESELKEDFELELIKLRQKYSGGEDDELTLDVSSSFGISEETNGVENGDDSSLPDKFVELIQGAATLKGNELSSELQKIADIILQSHGAVAANAIRQWISKLRSIRDLLEDKIREEFISDLESWKEKFA